MSDDRERFLAHVRYWKDVLNLGNYFVSVQDGLEDLGGQCEMNHESLLANIRLGEVDEIFTVERVARHEMLELLIEPLYAAMSNCVHPDISYRAGHEVIHRLENILPLPTDEEVGMAKKKKGKKKPVPVAGPKKGKGKK